MKQPESLFKLILVPLLASIGLLYFSGQMLRDVYSQGDTMTTSMWIAVGVMILGAIYGFRLTWVRYRQYQADHPAPEPEPVPEEIPEEKPLFIPDPDGSLDTAAEVLARLITGNRNLLSQFKKDRYPRVFESYCCQLEEGLAYLRLYQEDPDVIGYLASKTMELLEADWAGQKGGTPNFNDQLLISIYLMPSLVHSEEDVAMDFAHSFRSCWQKRYPQSVFEIGTYEQICKGFEKRFGCFITTAVCQSQGKADDCYELTQFRRFRDSWLANQKDGQAMIARYYDVAPSIVILINLQSDAPEVYRDIRETYLKPCLSAIEQGNNQACLARYRDMVDTLSRTYSIC